MLDNRINTKRILNGNFGDGKKSPTPITSPKTNPTPITKKSAPKQTPPPATEPQPSEGVRMKLVRYLDDGRQTLGVIQVYDEKGKELFEVESLELPFRKNQSSISAIPIGTYTVRPRNNSHYGNHFFVVGNPTYPKKGDPIPSSTKHISSRKYDKKTGKMIKTLPGYLIDSGAGQANTRTSVLIHTASSSKHLMGCIAPGSRFSTTTKGNLIKGSHKTSTHVAGNAEGNPAGIRDSRKALNKIYNILGSGGDFTMVIENAPTLAAQLSPKELTDKGVSPTIGT